jgi:SAM-dependent methyltransferase
MARTRIYRLLEIPWIFNLTQRLLAPGHQRLQASLFDNLKAVEKGPVLDVGCGPRPNMPAPGGVLVGVDINPDYVRRFTGGPIDDDIRLVHDVPVGRQRLGYVGSADRLPFESGTFAEVRCRCLLHHLPRPMAMRALREMLRCTRPGGRLVVVDPVWPRRATTRPLGWLLLKLDRGEWVRTEEQLVDLGREACPGPWTSRRYLLSYHGTEGVFLTLRKSHLPALALRAFAAARALGARLPSFSMVESAG